MSLLEHMAKKAMWGGSREAQAIEIPVLDDDKFVLQTIKMSPGLMKIIDEVLTNAGDHHISFPKKVTEIRITFDQKTGEITVYNNGPGIRIKKIKNIDGIEMYTVQMIVSEPLSGDNLHAEKNLKGGTNGVGLKLAAIFSTQISIETVDEVNKLKYRQSFAPKKDEHGKMIIAPSAPVITPSTVEPYTIVKLLPNYSMFELRDMNTVYDVVRTRVYQTAAYVSAKVYFNDNHVDIDFKKYCEMSCASGEVLPFTMSSPETTQKWRVCIAISSGTKETFSIVNGVHVKAGNHLKHIQNAILEAISKPLLAMLKTYDIPYSPAAVLNQLLVMMCGAIESPTFPAQNKENLGDPISKFEKYMILPGDAKKIWEFLEEHLESVLASKKLAPKSRVMSLVKVAKCRDADLARNKNAKCTLFICEGDSAMSTVSSGIATVLGWDYYGVFSIQGVPTNGLKESKEVRGRVIPKKSLIDNERFSALMRLVGLDYNKTYEDDREYKGLRYGYICAAVDQDEDGRGHIFGLILTFIMRFWPALVKRGFVKLLNTPIIRVYSKKPKACFVFYSEKKYKEWVDAGNLRQHHTVKFYKGLGSHSEPRGEVKSMFKAYSQIVITYVYDPQANASMMTYHGEDTAPRKVELRKPITWPVTEDSLEVPVSEQYHVNTGGFQRKTIHRKLPSNLDSFVDSWRKVLYVARLIANRGVDVKTAGLAAECTPRASYQHGEASLSATVSLMAVNDPSVNLFPLLRDFGQFGTKAGGFDDYSDPRYTYVRLNARLCDGMFPPKDDPLLDYELREGAHEEPISYIPIVPLGILRSQQSPATGWRVMIWARDWDQVSMAVRESILKDNPKPPTKFRISTYGFNGDIRKLTIKGKTQIFSVGKYRYDQDKNEVYVTELPFNSYANAWLFGKNKPGVAEGISALPLVKECRSNRPDRVDIVIELVDGALEQIQALHKNPNFDCFEEYLGLYARVDKYLNYCGVDGGVREYESYEDVYEEWFKHRAELYGKRVHREIYLLELEVTMLENIVRFCKAYSSYGITSKHSKSDMEAICAREKYIRMAKGVIDNPKFRTIDEIRADVYGEDASFDYLINIRIVDMSSEANEKRLKRIADLETELKDLRNFRGMPAGYHIWIKELDALIETVALGRKLGWGFGEDDSVEDDDDEGPKSNGRKKSTRSKARAK